MASAKEAEQAGQQLIKERETLAEKIQKLKVPFKRMSGDHLATKPSMSGFKFAVSFLFNSATEAMATAAKRAREVTVLSIL